MDKILNNKHFKYGLPFIITVVGGSYGLSFYSQLRYDLLKEKRIVTKTEEVLKITKVKPKSLEEEHQDFMSKVDIDNWKNIRGPRPWEDDNTEYKELIERRLKLVSLDTHPANNALVVGYEILVRVLDSSRTSAGGRTRELARRTKRDQLQINVTALDRLSEDDLARPDKLMINLEAIGREIVRKCPLLQAANEGQPGNIKLHLLYLVNRRQAQLQAAAMGAGTPRPVSTRPFSRKGRSSAASSSTPFIDVYSSKVMTASNWQDTFLEELDEYLDPIESHFPASKVDADIDLLLEGLYGDELEQSRSMAAIRRMLKGGAEELRQVSCNKLLICAMLRTLRDQAQQETLRLQLLYCLIRVTSFEDLHRQLFNLQSTNQLLALVVDLIRKLTADWSQAAAHADNDNQRVNVVASNSGQPGEKLLYAESLLMLLLNLLSVEARELTGELLLPDRQLTATLVELLQLTSKHLTREMRLMNKLQRSLKLLAKLVCLLRHLSTVKEFVVELRNLGTSFAESLVALLAILQLSRPTSGAQQAGCAEYLAKDGATLSELYNLELQVIQLTTNLLYDRRLRWRLIKRNLLKCVLRNLVVLLASRRADSLGPFHESPILLVPLKCLYELTCEPIIRLELHKSRIIIKCLFEYLLSMALDLKMALESLQSSDFADQSQGQGTKQRMVLEATSASHYMFSIWMNLTTNREAPMYKEKETELGDLLGEFVDICINSVDLYCSHWLIKSKSRSSQGFHRISLLIYLELKLLRNLTQFLAPNKQPVGDWIRRLEPLSCQLLERATVPVSTECLAALSNLIRRADQELQVIPNVTFVLEQLNRLAASGNAESNRRDRVEGEGGGGVEEGEEEDGEEDDDDLLLVAINYLTTLACSRQQDICNQFSDHQQVAPGYGEQPDLAWSLVEACGIILAAKGSDRELIVACLCALNQLMSHPAFLRRLLRLFGQLGEPSNDNKLPLSSIIGQLVDQLCELMFHARPEVAKLTNCLLNGLRQLEQQAAGVAAPSEGVQRKRFASYNGKWLSAIAASRDSDLSGSDFLASRDSVRSTSARQVEKELEEDEFGQVRDLDNKLSSASCDEEEQEDEGDAVDVYDDDDDDDDDGDNQDSSAPDLNVIDSNSMVKHLTSRREFRSEWLRR